MVICMVLYQGLQIFAGRFGGKCLDQGKHCRPQRNPSSSSDHSRTLLYPVCGHHEEALWTFVRLEEPMEGSKSIKDLDLTQISSLILCLGEVDGKAIDPRV